MDDRFGALRTATATALLRGAGATSPELRAAVARGCAPPELTALVEKIHRHAYTVTDRDIDDLRSRYSDEQLFEIIVAASFGAAETRLNAGLRALDDA